MRPKRVEASRSRARTTKASARNEASWHESLVVVCTFWATRAKGARGLQPCNSPHASWMPILAQGSPKSFQRRAPAGQGARTPMGGGAHQVLRRCGGPRTDFRTGPRSIKHPRSRRGFIIVESGFLQAQDSPGEMSERCTRVGSNNTSRDEGRSGWSHFVIDPAHGDRPCTLMQSLIYTSHCLLPRQTASSPR